MVSFTEKPSLPILSINVSMISSDNSFFSESMSVLSSETNVPSPLFVKHRPSCSSSLYILAAVLGLTVYCTASSLVDGSFSPSLISPMIILLLILLRPLKIMELQLYAWMKRITFARNGKNH